jgi:hypothetical protein
MGKILTRKAKNGRNKLQIREAVGTDLSDVLLIERLAFQNTIPAMDSNQPGILGLRHHILYRMNMRAHGWFKLFGRE